MPAFLTALYSVILPTQQPRPHKHLIAASVLYQPFKAFIISWLLAIDALRPESFALHDTYHRALEADVVPIHRQQFASLMHGIEHQRHQRRKPWRSKLRLGLLQTSLNLSTAANAVVLAGVREAFDRGRRDGLGKIPLDRVLNIRLISVKRRFTVVRLSVLPCWSIHFCNWQMDSCAI
jgi:hypothetical protein